jgi:Spy/CpxP family protein refolding chaperone
MTCRQAAAGGNESLTDDGFPAARRERLERLRAGNDEAMPSSEVRRPFGGNRFQSGEPGPGVERLPGLERDMPALRRKMRRNFDAAGQSEDTARGGGRQFGAARRRQPGAPGVSGRNFLGGPLNFQKLGLSEEQKNKIRDLRSKNSGRARELRSALRDGRTEMRQLLFSPDATEAQIKSKRRALRQMQDQMEEMQIDDFLSMRSVLTVEQRKRLPEIMPGGAQPQMLPESPSGARSGPLHGDPNELPGERPGGRPDRVPDARMEAQID